MLSLAPGPRECRGSLPCGTHPCAPLTCAAVSRAGPSCSGRLRTLSELLACPGARLPSGGCCPTHTPLSAKDASACRHWRLRNAAAGLAARRSPTCQNRFKQPGRGSDNLQGLQNGPCPVRALRQTARVEDPRTPLSATPVARLCGWLLDCHAASNSQGWGPKCPKRPASPHLSWSLASIGV